MQKARRFTKWIALAVLASLVPAWAQTSGEDGLGGKFIIQDNDNEPVIQLRLGAPQPGRSQEAYLRVYGSGTVRVVKPGNDRNAETTARIAKDEVKDLVSLLSQKRVMLFDEDSVRDIIENIENDRDQRGRTPEEQEAELHAGSMKTIIDISLSSYQPPGSERPIRNYRKTIEWDSVQSDARKYPSIQAIQYLAEAVNTLIDVGAKPTSKNR